MSVRVEISHLSKSFGALQAVKDISFTVEQGEVLGFLGPNGAGKSTTMKMLAGFLTPTSGTATVCGHDVRTAPLEVKRAMGYLPEGAPSYGEMTPRGFLEFVASVRGMTGSTAAGAVDRAVGLAQLGGVVNQRIETLSKGYKRRVGIAQAILHDPSVLILDEPTDGLDPNQKHEVRSLIREMGKDKVIILSTHILEEVDAVCSRAIIIANGELKADGTPDELHQHTWGGMALRVSVRATAPAPDTALEASLSSIPGVQRIEAVPADAKQYSYRLWTRDGADLRETVGAHIQNSAWSLVELSREASGLDEVFREITTNEKAAS